MLFRRPKRENTALIEDVHNFVALCKDYEERFDSLFARMHETRITEPEARREYADLMRETQKRLRKCDYYKSNRRSAKKEIADFFSALNTGFSDKIAVCYTFAACRRKREEKEEIPETPAYAQPAYAQEQIPQKPTPEKPSAKLEKRLRAALSKPAPKPVSKPAPEKTDGSRFQKKLKKALGE